MKFLAADMKRFARVHRDGTFSERREQAIALFSYALFYLCPDGATTRRALAVELASWLLPVPIEKPGDVRRQHGAAALLRVLRDNR